MTPPNGAPALEMRNVEVFYHRLSQVLRGVSLSVPEGSIVALLGPNGAGKTTALRAVSGLLDVHDGDLRKGRVLLRGDDVTRAPASRMVRRGLAQVLEGRQVFPDLTVEENLRTGAHTRPRGAPVDAELEQTLHRFPVLGARRRQLAGYLSGGEQQMLAIGRALMTAPKILLLDEPSLGWRRAWSTRSARSSGASTPTGRRCCSSSRTRRWRCRSRTTAT
jgi:branched-chain amino acid transport system ATP-binding protein